MEPATPSSEAVVQVLEKAQRLREPFEECFSRAAVSSALNTGLNRWQLWTLVCLVRHLKRQQWVAYVVESQLHGDLTEIGTRGYVGHPEGVDQSGEVPNFPDWKYYFHGSGCCLTHKHDGTSIDVDFTREGGWDRIDCYFYSAYLDSLKAPELPERLLKKPKPFEDSWRVDLGALSELGCVSLEGTMGIKILPQGQQVADGLDPVIERFGDLLSGNSSRQRHEAAYLALQLGDPVLALEFDLSKWLPNNIVTDVKANVDKATSERAAWLNSIFQTNPKESRFALEALADLGPEWAKEQTVNSLFRTPVDGTANGALEILDFWNQADLCPILKRVLTHRYKEFAKWKIPAISKSNAADQDANPRGYQLVHIAEALVAKLGAYGLDSEVINYLNELLPNVEKGSKGKAALIQYLIDRSKGLRSLKSALEDKTPMAQQEAAAACVIINTPETMTLLLQALENPDVQIQHAAACALKSLPDRQSLAPLKNWLARNDGISDPLGNETRVGGRTIETYSMDDVMHSAMDEHMKFAFGNLKKIWSLHQPRGD
jgi:hypothetical protein